MFRILTERQEKASVASVQAEDLISAPAGGRR